MNKILLKELGVDTSEITITEYEYKGQTTTDLKWLLERLLFDSLYEVSDTLDVRASHTQVIRWAVDNIELIKEYGVLCE